MARQRFSAALILDTSTGFFSLAPNSTERIASNAQRHTLYPDNRPDWSTFVAATKANREALIRQLNDGIKLQRALIAIHGTINPKRSTPP